MEKQQLGEQLWQLRVSLLRLAVSIVGNGHDAEDAVSSAIMKAMTHADDLRSPDSLKPWVMRITARCCYDLLRRRGRETPVCLEKRMASSSFVSPVYTLQMMGRSAPPFIDFRVTSVCCPSKTK